MNPSNLDNDYGVLVADDGANRTTLTIPFADLNAPKDAIRNEMASLYVRASEEISRYVQTSKRPRKTALHFAVLVEQPPQRLNLPLSSFHTTERVCVCLLCIVLCCLFMERARWNIIHVTCVYGGLQRLEYHHR